MFKPNGNKHKQPPRIGVAFDPSSDEIVVATLSPGGGVSILRANTAEAGHSAAAGSIRTPLRGWSAHTDNARLTVSAADDDEEILNRIIEGAQGRGGTSELRYTFGRTLDGRVVLTQALKTDVDDTLNFAGGWASRQFGRHAPSHGLSVVTDTPTRCLARLWLSGPVERNEVPNDTTVAFLVIGDDGYATALWSQAAGLVYETSERFKHGAADDQIAAHIQGKVTNFVSDDTISKLNAARQSTGQAAQLGTVSHLVVACCRRLKASIGSNLCGPGPLSRLSIGTVRLTGGGPDSEPDLVTALAVGAAVDSSLVPSADLSHDLQAQLEAVRTRKREDDAVRAGVYRRAAAVTLAAPALAVLIFMAFSAVWRVGVRSSLEREISREKATAEQLKQENADFEAAKSNFAVIKNLIGQISNLRSRQPDTYRLLAELNSRWPRGASAWYVSGVENVGNSLVVKGRTKDEQAITTFVSNLENSEGMFSGVTEDHKQQPATGTASAPTQQQPGVFEFTVKATYTPNRQPAVPLIPAQGAQQ